MKDVEVVFIRLVQNGVAHDCARNHAPSQHITGQFARISATQDNGNQMKKEKFVGRINALVTLGAILVVAGLLAFIIPVFTTQKTVDVARIGGLTIQSTQDTSHSIPPLLSGGVLAAGLILTGIGLSRNR